MKLRYKIGLVLLVLAFTFGLGKCTGVHPKPVQSKAAIALPKADSEEAIFDSGHHMVTTVTAKGSSSVYSRDPIVHILKNGTVKVQTKPFGLELAPFIGVGYSNHFNTYVGLNLVNVWRFDGGVALAYSPASTRLLLSVGCNVWSNSSVNLGIDLQKQVHAFLSVRF